MVYSNMETYEQREEKWVKENDVKIGDKVKVVSSCFYGENGWSDVWNEEMKHFINKECRVCEFNRWGIQLQLEDTSDCSRRFNFPYFVLEKVKEEKHKDMIGKEYLYASHGTKLKVIAVYKESAWCEYSDEKDFLATFKIKELKEVPKEIAVGDKVKVSIDACTGTVNSIVRGVAFVDWEDGRVTAYEVKNLVIA